EFYMVELVADPPYAIEGQFIPPGQDTITINPPSAQAGNTVTITVNIRPSMRAHIGRVDLKLYVAYDTWETVSLPGDPSGVYQYRWTIPAGYYGKQNYFGGQSQVNFIAYANKPNPSGQFYDVTGGAAHFEVPGLLTVKLGLQGRFVDEMKVIAWQPNRPKTIFARTSGGKPPFTFRWAIGGETLTDKPMGEISNISGLPALERAQTITVTVTDANGNQATGSFVIGQPPDYARVQECESLVAQLQQAMSARDLVRAGELLRQGQQRCRGLRTPITMALQTAQTQMRNAINAIEQRITQSITKCEFEEALRIAEQLRQIEPTNRYLSLHINDWRKWAIAQAQSRALMQRAEDALKVNNLEAAVSLMKAALAVPDLPTCLRNRITNLLSEAERRMRFVDLTRKVEQAIKAGDLRLAADLMSQISSITPREQFMADWINANAPILADLQRREQEALAFINKAATLANQAAASAGAARADWNAITAILKDAARSLADAENVAPPFVREREKARIESIRQQILDIQRRRPQQIETSIVLLIDTSGSMSGSNKIEQAKRAARASVSKVSRSTEMAVLHFDGGCDASAVKIAAPFSTDARALMAAIDNLTPGGGTPMYIATAVAVDYVQRRMRETGSKQGLVVLMSDGADTCRDQRTQASDVVRTSNIPVNTIGFDVGSNREAQQDLASLASLSRGRSYLAGASDPKEIIRAFNLALLPSLLKDWDARLTGAGASAVQSYFDQARSLLQRQDTAGALFQFQQAHRLAPQSPAINYNLSLMYEAQDQLISAIEHAQSYLKFAPDALDRSDVEARIASLEDELRRNPRSRFDPAACRDVYVWAQAELEAVKRLKDVGRRQAVMEIMITAQRGDCERARQLQAVYKGRYP
ncbi:MAG: vWA domain-containing protein, partial [Acidobacteriota bacterium]